MLKVVMGEIKLLSKDVANSIAAGEVVERPVNVVKELVENSLDAGADIIKVEILDGGIGLIRVIDNGKGILPDDIEQTVTRFATSKISEIGDVYKVNSFGFRGEALAAISSVSDFSIKTVRQGHEALELVVEEGITNIKPTSISKGTIVTVKNIFDNIPARKKFIKSTVTEQREILKFIKHFALINSISLSLTANGKLLFETYKTETMLEKASKIFNEKDLISLENDFLDKKIKAVISLPNIQKFRKDQIIIGINGRLIKDNQLIYAVMQAYHRLLPDKRYPIAVLNIFINPSEIDVNVHPAKSQIKFYNQKDIFNFVYKSIKSALENTKLNDIDYSSLNTEENNRKYKNKVREFKETYNYDISKNLKVDRVDSSDNFKEINQIVEKDRDFEVIGQLFDTVIICQKDEEVFFIDQHIAHERVLFEKYKKNGIANISSMQLIESILVELSDEEVYLTLEHKEILKSFGYEVELFGTGSIKIISVPLSIINKNIVEEFKSLISEISHTKHTKQQDYAIVTMACKTAIKAGEKLSNFEMNKLVEDLFETENPFTCPHGRPIIFKMNKEDIYRKFQR